MLRCRHCDAADLHARSGRYGYYLKCAACEYRAENRDTSFDEPPLCPDCGALLRPDVVWFGETFAVEVLTQIDALLGRGGVMLVVGTSGAVSPAADFAAIARARGAFTIEVNPEASLIASHMDAVVRVPSGEALPRLLGGPASQS